MSVTIRQTIVLKCGGDLGFGYMEDLSAEDNILPGMLLQKNVDGSIVTNDNANVKAEIDVAIEDDFIGMSITGARPDSSNLGYMIGDRVRYRHCQRGDWLNMILKSGTTAVVKGDYLSSNADGKLLKTTGTNYRMFRVVEAADPAAADVRVVAEVI